MAAGTDAALVEHRPAAVGALLIATALLRTGAIAGGLAIGFDLTDLAHGHPRGVLVGAIASVQSVSEMLLSPVLARFADRLGRRRFLIGGPVVGAIGLLVVSIAVHPGGIAAARLIEGVAAAAFVPTALGPIAAATSHSEVARARASGAFEGANVLGYALGSLVAGFTYYYLHRNAFVLIANFYLVAALICAVWVPLVRPLPVSSMRTVTRAILGRGPIRVFIPAWMASFAILGAFIGNLPSLLKSGTPQGGQALVHSLDPRVISGSLAIAIGILLLGIAIWSYFLPRIGAVITMRRAIPGAWVVCAGLLAINHNRLGLAPLFGPIVVVGILILAGFGPAAVTYLAECSENLVADRSSLMAFYTVALAGGGLIGALLGGVAQQIDGVDGLLLLGVALSVFAYFSVGLVMRHRRSIAVLPDEIAHLDAETAHHTHG